VKGPSICEIHLKIPGCFRPVLASDLVAIVLGIKDPPALRARKQLFHVECALDVVFVMVKPGMVEMLLDSAYAVEGAVARDAAKHRCGDGRAK
jgi:hypothetical protein